MSAAILSATDLTPAARNLFWSRVARSGSDQCWPWTAGRLSSGYGRFHSGGKAGRAHVLAWELAFGPVDSDKHLDHQCHNSDSTCLGAAACLHRRCVNPAHLELTTLVTNVMRGQSPFAVNARKTHCKRGHELTGDNVAPTSAGGRRCAVCARAYIAPNLVTHCRRGHAYDEANTYLHPSGRRACRACGRIKAQERRAAAAGTGGAA
jgi:hypothetical protein